jgi:hypothetical protein
MELQSPVLGPTFGFLFEIYICFVGSVYQRFGLRVRPDGTLSLPNLNRLFLLALFLDCYEHRYRPDNCILLVTTTPLWQSASGGWTYMDALVRQ